MHLRASLLANLLLFVFLAEASFFSPFFTAADSWNEQIANNDTSLELLKRASNACPTDYKACSNEGASGLCCASSQVCTADNAGFVACCPSGATCTGTITGVITGGAIAAGGSAVSTTAASGLLTTDASTTTGLISTTTGGLVLASATSGTTATGSATTTDGFIIAGSTTVATVGSTGMKSLQTPLYARIIIRLLEFLPL
ncbi:hypothetical protein BDV97DRAFT_342949 [Delphinella strobiligena]|nr:hypothetical protein BDV97DRAFT_342949 [Delphinella strobiligena]